MMDALKCLISDTLVCANVRYKSHWKLNRRYPFIDHQLLHNFHICENLLVTQPNHLSLLHQLTGKAMQIIVNWNVFESPCFLSRKRIRRKAQGGHLWAQCGGWTTPTVHRVFPHSPHIPWGIHVIAHLQNHTLLLQFEIGGTPYLAF